MLAISENQSHTGVYLILRGGMPAKLLITTAALKTNPGLVIIGVDQAIERILGVGEERMLPPGIFHLLCTLRAGHHAPEGIILKRIEDEHAHGNGREHESCQRHQDCGKLSLISILGLSILSEHRQCRQSRRGGHCWVEVASRLLLWAGHEAVAEAQEQSSRNQQQSSCTRHN